MGDVQRHRAVHRPCTMAEYHADPAWSRSQIGELIDSPPLFYGRHIAKWFPREKKGTTPDAKDIGTVAHWCLSNPGGWEKVVEIIPREVLNAQGHRKGKVWEIWKAENPGKILMKHQEFIPVDFMVTNVWKHPKAKWLLSRPGPWEHSLFWTDEETGLDLRARPDKFTELPDGRVVVIDFKTTKAPTAREFAGDAFKFGYHRQAAWYCDGVSLTGAVVAGFIVVSVDKTPAYECRVFQLSEQAIELGRQENRAALRDLSVRLSTDHWESPGWGDVLEIDLPEYAYKQDQWEVPSGY